MKKTYFQKIAVLLAAALLGVFSVAVADNCRYVFTVPSGSHSGVSIHKIVQNTVSHGNLFYSFNWSGSIIRDSYDEGNPWKLNNGQTVELTGTPCDKHVTLMLKYNIGSGFAGDVLNCYTTGRMSATSGVYNFGTLNMSSGTICFSD